ncbi:MAG TPA: bestrophin family protein [Cytophagaceae bacterium]
MIKYNPKNWGLLFTFQGVLLKKLLGGMIVQTSLIITLAILDKNEFITLQFSNTLPGYMGVALGLLLVFRNNTAYDKWWEARKEIGALINITRNFAITINGLLPPANPEKKSITQLIIAFVYATKGHLRRNIIMNELKGVDPDSFEIIKSAQHKPNIIANLIMKKVELIYKQKLITDIQHYLLITKVNTLVDIMGKCERIRNTPIPIAYAFLLKFFIIIYVVILPIGLFDDLGYYAIPLGLILYYILMSIVLTAEEIEEPFGKDMHDLPFDELAGVIRKNLLEITQINENHPA